MNEDELATEMKLSPKLAVQARRYWLDFVEEYSPLSPALLAYSGMVYKKINAKDFTSEDWAFAEEHLRICSFIYGMIRPRDGIRPYRMEGTVRLGDGSSIFDYWKDVITSYFIDQVRHAGGTVINLASEEMKCLFHWKEVEEAVRVISPVFETRQRDGRLKSIVIYCKMARGQMIREIIKNRITNPEALKLLRPEGFVYDPERSDDNQWHFNLEV